MSEQRERRVEVFGRTFQIFGDLPEWKVIRVLSRINFEGTGGCWEWTGALKQNGYGAVAIFVGKQREVLAHRYIWHVLRGPLSKDLQLHHKCENRRCVNPDHLEPLTFKEHYAVTPQNVTRNSFWSEGTCPEGHALEDNLYVSPTGHRRCRACFNEWQNRRNKRAAEEREPKTEATHCGSGHEFTPENTYLYHGLRYCRACHNDFTSRQYHEKKQALGIATSKRVYFKDKTACKRGHDLTNPENVMVYRSKGEEKRTCRLCHEMQARASYDKLKLAHARDPKPLRRKPGPKPLETSSLQISQ